MPIGAKIVLNPFPKWALCRAIHVPITRFANWDTLKHQTAVSLWPEVGLVSLFSSNAPRRGIIPQVVAVKKGDYEVGLKAHTQFLEG